MSEKPDEPVLVDIRLPPLTREIPARLTKVSVGNEVREVLVQPSIVLTGDLLHAKEKADIIRGPQSEEAWFFCESTDANA